jgi:hypothetical protein
MERKSGAHTPAKSTPRPWVLDDEYPQNVYSDDSTGSIIATCDGFTWAPRDKAEVKANAALIVRAVNAFDPLVSALELAVTLFEGDDECQTPGKDACMWLFDARAALSLAKDGTK